MEKQLLTASVFFAGMIGGGIPDPDSLMDYSQPNNKHGIDILDVTIHFWPVLEFATLRKMDQKIDRLKSYIVSKILRGLTTEENINLLEGLRKYVISEPGTDERMASLEYLFQFDFLTHKTKK